MKKVWIIVLVLLLILGGAGWYGYQQYQHKTYLTIGEETYRRDITQLDFSGETLPDLELVKLLQNLQELNLLDTGLTVAQYEDLQKALPDCEILWELPFQGQYLPLDTKSLALEQISQDEMALLPYLQELEAIDATAMTDLETVMALKESYPHVAVTYQVAIAGQVLPMDAASLTVENGDVDELMTQLAYLPQMADITFTGTAPANDAIMELKAAYPAITCHWNFTFFGQEVSSDTTEIDLSGIAMADVTELEEGLQYFNGLQKVVMCDTGLPSEEIDNLWKRHPETRFVWNVKIGKFWVRTDATTLMPFQYGYNGTKGIKLYDKDCTEMKYLVDMVCMDFGHMGIQDVSFLAYMPNLEYLIIADAPITDISAMANLKKLKYLEAFLCNIYDISPLLGCTALEDINLSNNPIQDITVLGEIETLNNIWISGREWPYEQKQELNAAKPDAKIVYYQDVGSTSKGWRSLDNYFNQRDLLGMWYMSDEGDVVYERPKK